MSESDLLAETNDLLRRLVEIDERNRREIEESEAKWDAEKVEFDAKILETKKRLLTERGVPEEGLGGEDKDWEKRIEEGRMEMTKKMETLRDKDEEYKQVVLAELQKQSDLLKQIAAKLDV
jgi:hypothetical protein